VAKGAPGGRPVVTEVCYLSNVEENDPTNKLITKTRFFLLAAATMAALNFGLFATATPAYAASGCEVQLQSTMGIMGGCSGRCIDGTRQNCFACAGLCWVCGDDC
jgi:hypothetical protein